MVCFTSLLRSLHCNSEEIVAKALKNIEELDPGVVLAAHRIVARFGQTAAMRLRSTEAIERLETGPQHRFAAALVMAPLLFPDFSFGLAGGPEGSAEHRRVHYVPSMVLSG